MKKTTFAASLAATTTGLLLLAAPLSADAHVRVDPGHADPGSYATLTFKVPTESATAGTVKLVVDLPTRTPFTSVSYLPVAGWTTSVETEKLPEPVKTDGGTITEAPVRVTWTAESGTQIAPGQFQEFTISAGAVPDTGSILLPTHQYYSDGSVVDWAEKTSASGDEPEHPAPTLYVTDPAPEAESAASASSAAPQVATSTATPTAAAAGTTATAVSIGLGIAGLALGAIALVVAVFALTRRGKVRA